jgi:Ser/Thr protein kinase RdoA (MazF antagonist)
MSVYQIFTELSKMNLHSAYRLSANAKIEPFGTGLINHTWKVSDGKATFILQRINTNVFKNPEDIAANIELVAKYLETYHADYQFVAPILTNEGKAMFQNEEGCFRMFPFVEKSHSKDVVETAAQAYEAARQFGKFTRLLADFDASQLTTTIPQFHDLTLRYQQFLTASVNGNSKRIASAKNLIENLLAKAHIVDNYQNIVQNPEFKLRVTHHDTKISNVLFDKKDKALCVIDLDTLMSGYFISDLGDMMRTYLSPVSEEESDFSKIEVRKPFYDAIIEGYYSEMKGILTQVEKEYLNYAGQFMIYMQALRFLTDYLNDDIYYGAKYPEQNVVRAENQLILLEQYLKVR